MKIRTNFAIAIASSILCFDAQGGTLKDKLVKNEAPTNAVEEASTNNNAGTVGAETAAVSAQNQSTADTQANVVEPVAKAVEAPPVSEEPQARNAAAEEGGAATPAPSPSAPARASAAKGSIVGDPVVMKIGRREFKRSEILSGISLIAPQILRTIPPEKLFQMLMDHKMSTYLMVIQAKKAGIEKTKAFLEKQEQAKEELLAKMYLMAEIAPKTESESVLKRAYDRYKSEFKKSKETRLWHIMVSSEKEAKQILKDLASGADFSKIATEKSIAPSKMQGGDEGYIPLDALKDSIKKKLIPLRNGEVAKEPIQIDSQFHVFKVGDSRDSSPHAYEDVKPMLKQNLVQKAILDLIAKLEKQHRVVKFNEDGTPRDETTTVPAPQAQTVAK